MSATPFIWAAFVLFTVVAVALVREEFFEYGGDRFGQVLAVFFVVMAVWAAGLLLQPRTIL